MMFQRLAMLGVALLGAVSAQNKGVYNRPTNQVTGNPDWWVPNHRSPCPAMNSLANHGHINRNGKDLTKDILKNAIKSVFNVDDSIANFIVQDLPNNKFTLADLSRHNFIEHDASLVHADVFYKLDPAQVDGGLANDLLGRADRDRMLGVREVGEALRVRLIWCQQKRGGCDFKSNQRDITFREAAKLLMIFGSKRNNNRISIDDAYSFLVEERFPDGWKKADRSVNLGELNNLSTQVQRVAGVA